MPARHVLARLDHFSHNLLKILEPLRRDDDLRKLGFPALDDPQETPFGIFLERQRE